LAGSILGLLGGPVGAVFGGIVGSFIGGIFGKITSTTHTETMKIGDNKNEVIQNFKKSRLKNYESLISCNTWCQFKILFRNTLS
jgi:uncharacterized protein YcfJ